MFSLGTPKDLISYPLFENVFTPHLQQEHQQLSYPDWITNFHRKEIGWMSEYPEPLDIYFYDEEVGNVLVAALNPFEAQTVWLDTYLGHIFRVIHPVTEELIDEIIVQYDSYHTYFVDFQRIELKNLDHREDLLNGVNDTLYHEYARSLRVQRTFTPLGFAKGTLPRDIYASMMTYYLNNYNSVYIEDWKVTSLPPFPSPPPSFSPLPPPFPPLPKWTSFDLFLFYCPLSGYVSCELVGSSCSNGWHAMEIKTLLANTIAISCREMDWWESPSGE
jgi:hypothetical protein